MSDLMLPEGARLLHVGPHKTGSTAVQAALFGRREELLSRGVYYPGGSQRRRRASEQLLAAVREDGSVVGPLERWQALVSEVASAGAVRACVSDERFGKAPDHVVPRIVADLGGADAHVVAVARGYEALLPSIWQERVKAGRTHSYDDWLDMVLRSPEDPLSRRDVWHAHDTPALVARWVRHVGVERFTLVVADDSDPRHLLAVVEQLLGLPDGLLRADPGASNRSLNLAEVEIVRALSTVLWPRGLVEKEVHRLRRTVVGALTRVAAEVQGPRRPSLPAWAVPLVRARSEDRVERLRRTEVRVVGDLDRLLPAEGSGPPPDTTPTPTLTAAAAGTILGEVLSELAAGAPAHRNGRQSSASGSDLRRSMT